MPLFPRPLVSNLIGSTSSALGVGTLEVGATSDTTLARSGAGQLSMEGIDVLSLSNTKTLLNKTLNDSTNSIGDANTYVHDLTSIPNQTGGWTEYFVTGSDFTSTSATIVNGTTNAITSGTLTPSVTYEFEAELRLLEPAADVNGLKIAVGAGASATGTAATVAATVVANSTAAGAGAASHIGALDTLTVAFVTYASGLGTASLKGFFTASSTGTSVIAIHLTKVTSGTATMKVGSVLRVRKAHT